MPFQLCYFEASFSGAPHCLGGGYFGPEENCIAQTAGGFTGLFVAAVPDMYHLGLMTTPKRDIGRPSLLTAITAFYGLFFAVPLRKYSIRKSYPSSSDMALRRTQQ